MNRRLGDANRARHGDESRKGSVCRLYLRPSDCHRTKTWRGGKTANTSKTNRELLQLALGTVLKKRRKKKSLIFTSWHVYWRNKNSWKSKRTPVRRSPNTRFVVLCSAPAPITVQWSLECCFPGCEIWLLSVQLKLPILKESWKHCANFAAPQLMHMNDEVPCVPVLCVLHWLNLLDRSGASQKSSHAHIAGRCQVFD